MYYHLNLIINKLNSIGISKLGDVNVVRKTISMLPQDKHASIITILHNMEDLNIITLGLMILKLVSYEISWNMGQQEANSSSKSIALIYKGKKKMKGKKQVKFKLKLLM